jgi:hypothetical protein
MGKYLDRLNSQFDEITAGVEEILNRAADENRDVTKDEQDLVERETKKADDLKKSIDHYSSIEKTRSDVEVTRSKLPATVSTPKRQTTQVVEREQKLTDMFPTPGDYMVTVARALRGEKDAGEVIERALGILERDTTTQHQTTSDNPGLIPVPILGPIITLVDDARPFIQSITTSPLPAGKFDRPKITQHVAVGKQAAEKSRTESRKLLIDKLPVEASTYAGHLNVSRQDIKWSQPAIMTILAEDFAHEYAMETDADAVAQFVDGVSADGYSITVADWTPQYLRGALFEAAGVPFEKGEPAGSPDTFWMAADVWAYLGSLVNDNGVPFFPLLNPTPENPGTILGYKPVIDPYFPAGTAVIGKGSLVEWYEDLDGLIQVSEPDVLGQLVGYAGYGALLNTAPQVMSVLTLPAIPAEQVAAPAPAKASSAK